MTDKERGANEPVTAESSDEDMRDRARELHASDGEIEIDDGAEVSRGDAEGAYVQVWAWVPFEEDNNG